MLAFVAIASAGILRVSLLTYTHGQAGMSMFASELTRTATHLANRANAASTSFNSKVIAAIEQAQSQVVARDLAIANTITTAGQGTVALATGNEANNARDANVLTTKVNKSADNNETTTATAQTNEPKVDTSTTESKSETLSVATTPAPQSVSALPDFRSNSTPPTGRQTNATGGYAYGQCTYYVASKRQVGLRWGNARTWMSAAQREGYQTGKIPVPGAVAWTPNGWYGHVAYVERVEGEQVLISEMNFAGWNRVSQRWVNASSFGYIYGKS
jgi:surface antigen